MKANKINGFLKNNGVLIKYAVILLVLAIFWKHIKNFLTSIPILGNLAGDNHDEQQQKKNAEDKLAAIKVVPAKLTYPAAWYKSAAQQICESMDRPGYFLPTDSDGTDELALIGPFGKLKTMDDMKQLYKEFGNRRYVGSILGSERWGTMEYWFRLELDPKEDKKIWDAVKKWLAAIGVSL